MSIAEHPGLIEEDDEEGVLGSKTLDEAEKRGIFARCHNSIVGHLGADRTLKALSLVMVGLACVRISRVWFRSVPYARN